MSRRTRDVHIWVVAPRLGGASETWLWRQITGMDRLRTTVVASERVNAERYPLTNAATLVDPNVRAPADTDASRWIRRAARARRRNFAALARTDVERLLSIARTDPPDALLCHFGHTGARFEPLARALQVPLIVHFHGLDLSSSLRNRWYRWSLRATLPAFDACVVVGTHQRRLLRTLGVPEERIHLIPCGVPVDEFPLREDVARTGATRFITVSRLVPWKGVHVAIESVARMVATGQDAELDIVGGGPQRAQLEALTDRLSVSDRVRFLGELGQEDVKDALSASDVFVQHSLEEGGWIEGFGVSIAEAAATGLPVVVSDCGGITDQVRDGDTGFVVPQRDIDAMVERMIQLADDAGLRTRLGVAGRRQAEARFDTPRQVDALEEVVLDAIGSRTAARP